MSAIGASQIGTSGGDLGAAPDDARLTVAALAIRLRDKRDELLGGEMFADPAWDILLDLYVAGLRGRRVSVSDVCLGARVPQTTALRWIDKLRRDGIIVRSRDSSDARRIYVSLDRAYCERLDRLFGWLADSVAGSGDSENRSSIIPKAV